MRLIEDIIYKMPKSKIHGLIVYKLTDLMNIIKSLSEETVEIRTSSLLPFYIDKDETYLQELYWHELRLNLVNEQMFETFISRLSRKHSSELDPYFYKLHTTCYIESVLPRKEAKVADIARWIDYVINQNMNDNDMKKISKKYFNEDSVDINKLRFELFINSGSIYT